MPIFNKTKNKKQRGKMPVKTPIHQDESFRNERHQK
jgi:hypothetical protein